MEDDLNFFLTEDNLNFWEMEDNLSFFINGQRPSFLNGRVLKFLVFGRQPQSLIWKMIFNILANGRHPQFFGKWKTIYIFWKIEAFSIFWQRKLSSLY